MALEDVERMLEAAADMGKRPSRRSAMAKQDLAWDRQITEVADIFFPFKMYFCIRYLNYSYLTDIIFNKQTSYFFALKPLES